ncbi:MAG: DUF177 domain-containing protein [Actinobacteria bacterium]|nr:DUF177 domain-containing protein [Actinomycetota bacterium]
MSRRDPLVEHVAELRRRTGTRKDVRRRVPVHGLAISTAAVPDGAEAELDLVLESIPEGITVTGSIRVPWRGECRRCLRDVSGTSQVAVREIFETRPVEGETWPLEGDVVDLEPLVRESVLLDLPLAPLCDATCAGPAPDALPVTVEGAAEGRDAARGAGAGPAGDAPPDPPHDPRWAALDQLRLGDDR